MLKISLSSPNPVFCDTGTIPVGGGAVGVSDATELTFVPNHSGQWTFNVSKSSGYNSPWVYVYKGEKGEDVENYIARGIGVDNSFSAQLEAGVRYTVWSGHGISYLLQAVPPNEPSVPPSETNVPVISRFIVDKSLYNIGETVNFAGSAYFYKSWKIIWLKNGVEADATTTIQNNSNISYSATVNHTDYNGAVLYVYPLANGDGTPVKKSAYYSVVGSSATPNVVKPEQSPFISSTPSNVAATFNLGTISVNWNNITSARYGVYYIYCNNTTGVFGNWKVIVSDTPSYTIPTLVKNSTYYITILPFSDIPTRKYGGFSPYIQVRT